MIVSSGTKKPKIHSSAYVAPTAVVSGDVTIGADSAVLHGAVVVAEGAPVTVGKETVIMENAVLKASGGSALQFPLSVGDRCIVGPNAYVVGATIGNGCFIAGGERLSNGTKIEDGKSVPATQDKSFFEDVFNVEAGKDAAARAAQAYAKFLRKIHAQDRSLDEHRTTAPARRSGEEPPQTQVAEVDKVVDVMMLELEEMEHRRQEAIRRQKGK